MNWTLFLFTVAAGVTTGLVVKRGKMTQLEAWSLICGRVGWGLCLAWLVPVSFTPIFYFALGVPEGGRIIEFIAASLGNKLAVHQESKKWLQPQRKKAID